MIEYVKRLAGPFIAEGQTDLPFGFKIFEPTDVFVATSTDPNTSSSMLVYGKDYLVNMNPDQEAVPGGKVVLNAPVAKGQVVVVGSAVAYTQNMQLTNFSRFPPEIINESLDRIVVQIQQLVELTGRTISLPPTSNLTVSEFLDNLFNAAKSAAKSAEEAKKFAQICEEIKQSIFIYSWDIPHVVDTLDDVEKYPYDGLFAVGGYGDPGHHGQDISNRVVKALGSTKLRTLGERFADVVNVKDFGAVGDGVTDDTDAFEKAGATGKRVFVPQGAYHVTKTIEGNFFSDGDVAADYSKVAIGGQRSIGGVRLIFVDAENGSDFNSGLTDETAVKTMRRVVSIMNGDSATQYTVYLMGNFVYEVPADLFVFSGVAPHIFAYNGSPTLKFLYSGGAGPRFYSAHVNLSGSDNGNLIVDSSYNSLYFEGCSCTFSKVSFAVPVGIYGGNIASTSCTYARIPGSDIDLGGVNRKPALYLYMANARLYDTTFNNTDGASTGVVASHGTNAAIYGYVNVVDQAQAGKQPIVLAYNSFLALNYTSNADTFENKYNRSITLNWSVCSITKECFAVINKINPFWETSSILVGGNTIDSAGFLPGKTFSSKRMNLGGHITNAGTEINLSVPFPKGLSSDVTSVTVAFDRVTIRGVSGYIAEKIAQSAIGTVSVTYFNPYQINLNIALASDYQKPSINNTPVNVDLIGLNVSAN